MFFVIKFKKLLLLTAAFAICICLAVTTMGNDAASVLLGREIREVPIYAVKTDSRKLSLSFDTELGTEKTEQLLAELKRRNIKATFFILGTWAEKNSELTKQIADEGHEIATHSNTHPNFRKLKAEQIQLELATSVKTLEEITGQKIKYFRPPYGEYNTATLQVAKKLGLETILWDVDSQDHRNISAKQISIKVLNKVKNGSIVLFHNFGANLIDGLSIVLQELNTKGFEPVPIGDLVYKENFSVDHTGLQIQNKK